MSELWNTFDMLMIIGYYCGYPPGCSQINPGKSFRRLILGNLFQSWGKLLLEESGNGNYCNGDFLDSLKHVISKHGCFDITSKINVYAEQVVSSAQTTSS